MIERPCKLLYKAPKEMQQLSTREVVLIVAVEQKHPYIRFNIISERREIRLEEGGQNAISNMKTCTTLKSILLRHTKTHIHCMC